MIKIYDTNYKFLKFLPFCREAYTEELLETGFKTLYFQVPCLDEYLEIIQEENYVETQDYSYIIKEINFQNNDYIEVYCSPNIEHLTGRAFQVFDCLEMNLSQIYSYCLSKTDWILMYKSADLSIATYQLPNVNGFEMIKQVAEDYGQEFWLDTKKKILYVYDKMGKEFGALYSNELKLKKLVKQSSSYDYATILYPIGKDGLTIRDVNNGKNYLEDFSYSNKYIEAFFIDEEIEIPEILKQKAEEYFAKISTPRASYNVLLSSIGDGVELGDIIYLIDKIKHIKQKQRVVKIKRFLWEPERDVLEISNLQEDFARAYIKGQKEIKKEIQYLKKLYKNLE